MRSSRTSSMKPSGSSSEAPRSLSRWASASVPCTSNQTGSRISSAFRSSRLSARRSAWRGCSPGSGASKTAAPRRSHGIWFPPPRGTEMRRLTLTIVPCLLAWSAPLHSAGALESIVIAYPTTSSQFVPLWFARDVGLYEKYGLDGQLVFIQGGSVLLQAMLAGQAHAAQNGIAETMVAVLRGG